jgi:hypothetical protein
MRAPTSRDGQRRRAVIGLLCLIGSGAVTGLTVAAQDGGSDAAAATTGTGASTEAIGAVRATPTTPAAQLADAQRIISFGQGLKATLSTRVEAASRRSDIVMVDCLTPLLTQIEASLASGEARLRALRLLTAGGDQAAVEHEYTMVAILEPRLQLVEADMNQCLGDQDITTGDDRVTVEMTITLPDEDPTVPLDQPPVVAIPYIPPPLSPAF